MPVGSAEVRSSATSAIADIEACIPALRRYASALLHERQDTDDLVHDCLVRALEKLHTRRDEGDLRAWLFTIMHNLFVSRARHHKVRRGIEALDTTADAMLVACAGHDQDRYMQGRDLLRALDGLPEDQRTVLLLVTVEDLTYADVARIVGIPVGTVMSRLSRARERLRHLLNGDHRVGPALRRVK